MRFRIVVVAYTLWIIAVFGALYLTHSEESETALQLALLSGVVPVALQLLLLGFEWHGVVAPVKMWLAFLLIVLLSYLAGLTDPRFTPDPSRGTVVPAGWIPVVYTINVALILGIGTVFSGCPDRRLLRSVAGLFCVLLAPFLIYVDLTGERSWGNRLAAAGLQGNTWGGLGLTVCLGALARKAGPLAFIAFAAGITTILAAQSREHILELSAGLLVVSALSWRQISGTRLFTVLAGLCAVLIAIGMLLDPYILDAIHYVKADILLYDDPNRGINSGFTGRTGVWAATFEVWLKSPILGVGYREHEQFLTEGLPGHNAYLAMLADTGVVGFAWYLVRLIGSLVASFGIHDPRTRRFVAALIVARIVGGFFDRITINGGDQYSLLLVLCCSVALVDQSLRNAAPAWQGGAVRARPATANGTP
jgi:hypothetical protein